MLAGSKFIQNKEQDPSEFITQLRLKSENLRSSLYFDIVRQVACTQCDALKKSTETSSYIFALLLPKSMNYNSLQEIINYNLDAWIEGDTLCQCGAMNRVRNLINGTSDVLIIQMLIYNNESDGQREKITNFQLPSFENEIISISGDTYEVKSAILHHGPSPWPIQSGHYMVIFFMKRITG